MLLNNKKMHLIKELLTIKEQNMLILKKGNCLYEENIARNSIVILINGSYKLINSSPEGNEFIFGIYKDKSILLPTISERLDFVSIFKLEAITDCKFVIISYDTKLLKENFKNDLLEYEDLICQKLYLQMKDLMKKKELALLSVLMRFSKTYGIKLKENRKKINLKITNIILSECIGTSVETVSRIIAKLKNENVICRNGGYFILNDINYIRNLLGCDHCREELCEV